MLLLHEYGGGFGGAERYLQVLTQGFVESGLAVGAVVFAGDPSLAAGFVGAMEDAGAEQVWLHRYRSRPYEILRAVRRFRPDVMHWNAVDPFAFRGGTMCLLPWGRPSVLTDHLPMLRTGPHWETTRRIVNRRLPAVIVVGEQGAAAAREHWPSPPRLKVIVNGVRTEGVGRVRSAPEADPLHLAFVGRLADQKNPMFALDVVAALLARGVDTTLTIAGDGELRDALERRLAGDDALRGAVRMAGFVEDTSGLMREAALYLAPSRYEGLPFTPLEAMATGAPLILSDIPPHVEIAALAGDAVRLVPEGDLDAWVAAVLDLRSDLPSASESALAGAGHFSVNRMVEATTRVYADVSDPAERSPRHA